MFVVKYSVGSNRVREGFAEMALPLSLSPRQLSFAEVCWDAAAPSIFSCVQLRSGPLRSMYTAINENVEDITNASQRVLSLRTEVGTAFSCGIRST